MKKNRTFISIFLVIMTVVILGATIYISGVLNSPSSPTQIQKTKAAAVTYSKKVNLYQSDTSISPTAAPTNTGSPKSPTLIPTKAKAAPISPTNKPALIAQAPSVIPTKGSSTVAPTVIPTITPAIISKTPIPTRSGVPTEVPEPTTPIATPTLQPLLAYKSTSISPTPTLIPIKNTGGNSDQLKPPSPSPTKKIAPTGVQQLPETGWIQISTILFIVATSTILFSLLF